MEVGLLLYWNLPNIEQVLIFCSSHFNEEDKAIQNIELFCLAIHIQVHYLRFLLQED